MNFAIKIIFMLCMLTVLKAFEKNKCEKMIKNSRYCKCDTIMNYSTIRCKDILIKDIKYPKNELILYFSCGRDTVPNKDIYKMATNLALGIYSSVDFIKCPVPEESLFNLFKTTLGIKFGQKMLTITDVQFLNRQHLHGLTDLEELHIKYKKSPNLTIPYDLFADLNRIRILKILSPRHTTLTFEHDTQKLKQGFFAANGELEIFDLNVYELSLSAAFLANLPKLREVRISKCYLEDLPDDLFANSSAIEKIDLSFNKITHLPIRLLEDQLHLTDLNLAHNNLSNIEPKMFQNNTELRILNLSYNQIVTTSDILKINEITALNGILHASFSKVNIDLSHNLISYINITDCNNIYVNLNNNPLHCDCNLLNFPMQIRQPQDCDFKFDDLFCGSPSNSESVEKVSPELLLCPIQRSEGCPVGCECWRRSFDAVLVVNCTRANMTDWPALPKLHDLKLNKTEFYMEENQLTKLRMSSIPGIENMTEIHLAGNYISSIMLDKIPEGLQYLNLSNNNLTHLSNDVMEALKSTTFNFTLSGNPLSCECNHLKEFLPFLVQNSERLLDYKNLSCANISPLKEIYMIKVDEFCSNSLPIILISIGVVALLVGLSIGLIYKYNLEIKNWLYSRNTEDEVNQERVVLFHPRRGQSISDDIALISF